jgi:hypothetical protein
VSPQYRVIRADRCVRPVEVGQIVYLGRDFYGVSSDDTRATGIEHMAIADNESGYPFFTIPCADVERLP